MSGDEKITLLLPRSTVRDIVELLHDVDDPEVRTVLDRWQAQLDRDAA